MDKIRQYFEILLAFHALCSVIAATTKTPKDDTWVGKAYKLIEAGGLVIGRAKMR
jgi:hypothetical protein